MKVWIHRIVVGALLAGGIWAGFHCGTDQGSEFGDGACSALYGSRCGTRCSGDEACGDGMFCDNGRCNAECGAGHACANDVTCSPHGRCGDDFNPGFNDSGEGGSKNNEACADLDLTLAKHTPTVLVLIDRSGSMDQTFQPPDSRWTALKRALLDGGLIEQLQSDVVFGMQMYSNPANPPTCPDLEGVPYAPNNYAAIRAVLGTAKTQPETPTGEAILAVSGITDAGYVGGGLAQLDAGGGAKIILLVTDGNPDYCGDPRANDDGDAAAEKKARDIAIDGVQRAYQAGIKTYVLAIGNELDAFHQQQMANVGAGYSADAGDAAPFFRPANESELLSQINSVILGARSCRFTLNGRVQAGHEADGTVLLNGGRLGYNDANGWKLVSPTEIEIQGTACTTIKTAVNASLSARFPCDAVVRIY